MRTNPRNARLLHTPTLPRKHQFYSAFLVKLCAMLLHELNRVLYYLVRSGVVGKEEREKIGKDALDLSKRIFDIHQRERLAFSQRIDTDLGDELEEAVLTEIKANPDKARFVETPRLRQRLRSCTWNLIDFVETAVESLKRLRYSGYLTEPQYDRARRTVESLPELRVELLDLLEKHGGL